MFDGLSGPKVNTSMNISRSRPTLNLIRLPNNEGLDLPRL
jgi:dUTP pyrophosphatase